MWREIFLPSFFVFITPKQDFSPQQILEKAKKLSIFNNNESMREGILPAQTECVGNSVFFVFGFEHIIEYNTLKGKKDDKALGEVPVIFVNDQFLVTGAVVEEVESKVKKFVQDNFLPKYALEQIEFKELALRRILERSPDVFQIDHKPVRADLDTVDKITYIGRGVTDSTIHEDYGREPLIRIKVSLGELQNEARVGFDKHGVITIYQRSFTHSQQTVILRSICEKIIAPDVSVPSFQRRFSQNV
jgi:hypothetical protein